jgi:hypothetical protein
MRSHNQRYKQQQQQCSSSSRARPPCS